MSRAYRIDVAEGVQRVVHVEDGVQGRLELLPILPPERTAALLADALAARGFAPTESGVCVRVDGSIVTEVACATGTVTVSVAEERTLELSAHTSATETTPEAARAVARTRWTDAVDAQAAPLTEAARREVTARLERELANLRPLLDAAVQAATAAALLERAHQLGHVESVEGSAEAGTLTITVRV